MSECKNECKIEVLQYGTAKQIYLNGQNVSSGCTGIKVEMPAGDTTTVTLTFDADEFHIKTIQ